MPVILYRKLLLNILLIKCFMHDVTRAVKCRRTRLLHHHWTI